MVGCGGGLLRAGAPVGDQSEDVVDGYLAVTVHVAEASDWAWRVVAGCAITEPCCMEGKTVCLLSNHALTIGAAGTGYGANFRDGIPAFIAITAGDLVWTVSAHSGIEQRGVAAAGEDSPAAPARRVARDRAVGDGGAAVVAAVDPPAEFDAGVARDRGAEDRGAALVAVDPAAARDRATTGGVA